MIEETAKVVSCQAEFAWVETNRKAACDSCSMNKACGTGALSKVFGEKKARIKAINKAKAQAGDNVLIGINESALLRGSLMVYIVPLASMLGFALFGELLTGQLLIENTDLLPILFGMIGLVLSIWWVRKKTNGLEQNSRYQAVILKQLSQSENCQIETH